MRPLLLALAGPARSGKGTAAEIFRDGAQAMGLTTRERQLSGPGKQYVASAWRPDITEEEAIAWFDEMKSAPLCNIEINVRPSYGPAAEVPLQQYLQRMLQGARDRWGKDFWTDKLIPKGLARGGTQEQKRSITPLWWGTFMQDGTEPGPMLADLAIISDLRQESEAERVKALGGHVIEFQRPELDHAYVTGADHITEQRLSDIRPDLVDYIVLGHAQHNDETFDLFKSDCVKAWINFVKPLLETA